MIQIIINDSISAYAGRQLALKRKEVDKIFNHYTAEVIKYFMRVQGRAPKESRGLFWTNHTFKAVRALFSEVLKRDSEIVLNIEFNKNIAPYVKYLEEGFGGRFASLPTIVSTMAPMLIRDLKTLYGDRS